MPAFPFFLKGWLLVQCIYTYPIFFIHPSVCWWTFKLLSPLGYFKYLAIYLSVASLLHHVGSSLRLAGSILEAYGLWLVVVHGFTQQQERNGKGKGRGRVSVSRGWQRSLRKQSTRLSMLACMLRCDEDHMEHKANKRSCNKGAISRGVRTMGMTLIDTSSWVFQAVRFPFCWDLSGKTFSTYSGFHIPLLVS